MERLDISLIHCPLTVEQGIVRSAGGLKDEFKISTIETLIVVFNPTLPHPTMFHDYHCWSSLFYFVPYFNALSVQGR